MADGDKYIPNGVWLRCDKGTLPRKLSILPKTVKLYGQDWAGHLDAVPMVNIPTFGVCAIIKACMPVTVMWQGSQTDVSIIGQSPILDTSTCQCGVGGTIKIYFTKQAADDAGAEQEAKEDADFWGKVGMGLLVVGAVVGTAAIIVASGGTALAVLGAAAATGAALGGVAGAVDGAITGGAEGAASGFLMGAGLGALGGIAAVGAPLIAGAAAVAGMVSLGYLGKAFYHNPSKENGLVLVGAIVGTIAGGLTHKGIARVRNVRARYGKFEGDPARDHYGSGRDSHPAEWQAIIDQLKAEGVEVRHRDGTMAYGAAPTAGRPGQLIIDENASYSALKHEYQHYLDDKAMGFPGPRVHYDPAHPARRQMETKAYDIEIELAKKQGNQPLADELEVLKQQELERIDKGH